MTIEPPLKINNKVGIPPASPKLVEGRRAENDYY